MMPSRSPSYHEARIGRAAPGPSGGPIDQAGRATGRRRRRRPRRCGALSLIESLIALAITAILLTATMVAIDASFKAYAQTAAQSSSQAATRLLTHRLMSMIRTSTAHGPLMPDELADPPIVLEGNTIRSHYLELVDSRNNLIRVIYDAAGQGLWVTTTPMAGGTAVIEPLLHGVSDCTFFATRRLDDDDVWVLERASIDLSVQPPLDTTFQIESGPPGTIRVIASTMPRQLQ